jgi:two-component system chemotaxis response regulator CheB
VTAPFPSSRLRLLLVDDSALSLGELQHVLESAVDFEVVGHARDGEQALREVIALRPDAIVLDLQMPRMDGFTFLRLVMARRPTPVIVLSSTSRRADVFKSLELGALDFVAKPERGGLEAVRDELLAKCAGIRGLRLGNLATRDLPEHEPADPRPLVAPGRLAVIGASTGGPPALQELLGALPGDLPLGILVAQHMPEKFTRSFADRLGRTSAFAVSEATDGDLVAAGRALIAPGGQHLELRRERGSGALRVALVQPEPGSLSARYCPSIDRLFTSAALAMPRRLCAVVLTGMGSDGAAGLRAVKAAGGLTIAESELTAVIYGMPRAAVATGMVDQSLGLHDIAGRLADFARSEW